MIYALSDVHGCLDELKEKMKYVDLSGNNTIIFLGDYIDYGPKSGQVLRFLYELQKEYGSEKVIVLKGNHEAMFLDWIEEYKRPVSPLMENIAYDSWLKTDSECGYMSFKTLVTLDHFMELRKIGKKESFAKINNAAVKMVIKDNADLIKWLNSLDSFYETESQIFVHAGVDEEAGEDWELGSGDEIFLWKYPPTTGSFYKTVISGHIGTHSLAHDPLFHDIYHDGANHYYIDGTVYKGGKLLLLGYDEKRKKYYQVEKTKKCI